MKVIVAGSRSITDHSKVASILNSVKQKLNITELVHGGANGVDSLAGRWAIENNIPVKVFKADWNNLNADGAIIKVNRYGYKYNAAAGFQRNIEMAEYGDVLVAIWDGKSRGTRHMIDVAKKRGLIVGVFKCVDNNQNKAKVVNLRKDPYDVYIGRPSKWGNPFKIGKDGSREEVIAKYRNYILNKPNLLNSLHELKGKRLGCFCKPKPCHGDVLVELVEKLVK